MASVIWRQAALDDIDAIIVYIKLFDPRASLKTGSRLIALGQACPSFPGADARSLTDCGS
jgi:plasmid stabilization system protein ParE